MPPRMKIARALATWENLNNTPLSARNYDPEKNAYDSPTAHMCGGCVWATHPETKRIFFCMTSPDGEVRIPEGWDVERICALDSVFGEYRWAKPGAAFDVSGGKIRMKEGGKYVSGEGFAAVLKKKPAN